MLVIPKNIDKLDLKTHVHVIHSLPVHKFNKIVLGEKELKLIEKRN